MQNTTKVLVPLATLLAAGAIAVGSGATFTSTSSNTISAVTSGTLTHSNSKADKAVFNLTNLKPGDTLNGSLTLTNTGSLDAGFGLTEVSSTNDFSAENLKLVITDTAGGTPLYSGTFGGLEDGKRQALGTITAGAAKTYRFQVTLAQATGNEDQGKTATATYVWDSAQLTGTTTNQ
ncbi:TasA family protein [Nocardioides campestrisoli]|uniref:TasA family protein n=1 Tax=Nocardioides campestrisoli TaxID=2736757 RepID=UPI0015E6F7BF|nr:TasA family protein [Nocardioides campestrisoli]